MHAGKFTAMPGKTQSLFLAGYDSNRRFFRGTLIPIRIPQEERAFREQCREKTNRTLQNDMTELFVAVGSG